MPMTTARARQVSRAIAAAVLVVPAALVPAGTAVGSAPTKTVVVYDNFESPTGYSLADYNAKWSNPYGLLEMASNDTRNFAGGRFNIAAAPFTVGADFSVFDHLKYIGISNAAFAVPTDGSVTFSASIAAQTPGTEKKHVVHGTYVATGAPYAATTLQGQQAGVVLNMINFQTGQLFDWFVAGNTAFALIERLPSNVTGNASDPNSPDYVGREKVYTQIIREFPVRPDVPHTVAMRYSRNSHGAQIEYILDGKIVSTVDKIGVPLDRQDVAYTGIYPSLGAGEDIASKVDNFVIGHGLFSLLDEFPFQHPEAPELNVSVPMSERLFGQGAIGSFDDITVTTITKSP